MTTSGPTLSPVRMHQSFGIAIGGSDLEAFGRKTNLSATNSSQLPDDRVQQGCEHECGEDPFCGGEDSCRCSGVTVTVIAQW